MCASMSAANQPVQRGARKPVTILHVAFMSILLADGLAAFGSEDSVYDPTAPAEEILDALLEEPSPRLHTPLWRTAFDVRLGFGHAENVYYSPFTKEDSAFSASEGELFVFRQGRSHHYLSLYAFDSHRHHFDLQRDADEHTTIAQAGWEYRDAPVGTCSLRGTYYYFDQFFDASRSDVETDAVRLKQHDAGANSSIRYPLRPNLTAEVGSGYRYVALEHSDDDYGQWEGSASLEGRTLAGLSLELSYRYRLDDYEERVKRTAEGVALAGETVDIDNHELRLQGSWFWDTAHDWKTRLRVTTRVRDDDGGGYYDYNRWQGGVDTSARHGKWRADFSADFTDTNYDKQPSDALDTLSAPLHRQRWDLRLRLEREVGKQWTVFSEISWEDSDANDPLDVYDHFSGVAGVGYAFTRGN